MLGLCDRLAMSLLLAEAGERRVLLAEGDISPHVQGSILRVVLAVIRDRVDVTLDQLGAVSLSWAMTGQGDRDDPVDALGHKFFIEAERAEDLSRADTLAVWRWLAAGADPATEPVVESTREDLFPAEAEPTAIEAEPVKVERPVTRTLWLRRAMPKVQALFAAAGRPLPERPQVFARVTPNNLVGYAEWAAAWFRIVVSHQVSDGHAALAVLVHECCHVATWKQDESDDHGPAFQAVQAAVGLTGGATDATPGDALHAQLVAIADGLGDYPPRVPPRVGSTPDQDPDERGDLANATRFISDHLERLRYCPTFACWLVWNGRCWGTGVRGKPEVADAIVWPLAEQTARALGKEFLVEHDRLIDEADHAKGEEAKALKKSAATAKAKAEQIQKRRAITDFLAVARTRPGILVEPHQLDANEFLFSVHNGTVDLRTGKLLVHDRDHYITQCAPVPYDPRVRRDLLNQVLGNLVAPVPGRDEDETKQRQDDLRRYMQLVLGRSLFGNNAMEEVYFWHGPGGSGKGTLFESVKAAVGPSAVTANFKTFVKVQGERVRNDLARLAQARLVLASEVARGEHLDETVLKVFSGMDTVTARYLYADDFEFRPPSTLHMQCNELPRADDADSGLWRRLVAIPCGPTVHERDPSVKGKLMDPAIGGVQILAWLVEGARLAANLKRIDRPACVTEATAKWRGKNNPIFDWIVSDLRLPAASNVPGTWALVRDVLKSYHTWCDANYLDKRLRLGDRAIAERLERLMAHRQKKRVMVPVDSDGKGGGTRPEQCWIGLTVQGSEHAAMRQPIGKCSHMPTDEEHTSRIRAVPEFLSSLILETHTHARARPHTPENFSNLEEHRNTGTEENEEKTTPDPAIIPDLGDLP